MSSNDQATHNPVESDSSRPSDAKRSSESALRPDRLVRALHDGWNLAFYAAHGTGLAREARKRHKLAPSSAAMLGQGLVAGTLLAALQKEETTRINLQLECNGPIRGIFVDSHPNGRVRGYARNKSVNFPVEDRFDAEPLLGTDGYVSVLRDRDGDFYRGSVGLEHHDLSLALEHYFATSEQTDTALRLETLAVDGDELGWVGGVLVQRLPGGDEEAFARIRERLHSGIVERMAREGASPLSLLEKVADVSLDLLADSPLEYWCPCTRERVLRALSTLSNVELADMISRDGKAEADCDFCGAHYVVSEDELREVLSWVDERDARRARQQADGGNDGQENS